MQASINCAASIMVQLKTMKSAIISKFNLRIQLATQPLLFKRKAGACKFTEFTQSYVLTASYMDAFLSECARLNVATEPTSASAFTCAGPRGPSLPEREPLGRIP
jgi:hypothetical protein